LPALDDHSPEPEHRASGAIVEACTIEIAAQTALLALVVLPTAVIVYPSILIAFGGYFAANLAGDFSPSLSWLGDWAQAHWPVLLSLAGAAIAFLGIKQLRNYFRSTGNARDAGRRIRPLSGRAGEALASIVGELWLSLPQRAGSLPGIGWFSNFNVMASATESAGSREIQVSSALWERAVRRDPVAIGILAHEMAHLVFRDGRLLRPVEAIVAVARQILKLVIGVVLSVAALLMCSLLLGAFRGPSWSNLPLQLTAVLAFVALVLLVPVLGMLAIRRQGALIIALTEIRADAFAGLWTNGLSGFARALAADPDVTPSSLADIGHSVLSPDLTHVSTFERIGLLEDVGRLTTPKLRYLALSLALPFVFPLNPITPLLQGGALDHLFVAFVVVAAHVTTIAMVIVAAVAQPEPLVWRRVMILSVFLCVASALPHVNLYEIGYLLTQLSVALVVPGGFGADPITSAGVETDIATVAGSLWKQLSNAFGGGFAVLGIVFSIVSIRGLSVLAREAWLRWPSHWMRWLWILPAAVGGMVAFLSTYDEWRTFAVMPFNPGAYWMALTDPVPWLRSCAPELFALVLFAFQFVALRVDASSHRG
jgi:Zn-dependent protease with chaperone function